jgi:hypothetical protein
MTETAATKAKKLLPLNDGTAPIVCTIGDDEKADRIAIIERMRGAATSIERTNTGLLLRFPRTNAIRADLDRFAIDEKRCCQFWGFAVVDGTDDLALRWDGPDTAGELLDSIERVLRSDAPIESIEGLL